MRINQNITAYNAYRNLSVTNSAMNKSLEKLSSGFRINRAADDASGLVNSENLRAQIGGLKVASRNAQDAISLVQTAEGAMTEVHSILQRMRDLAVHAANAGANDTTSTQADQSEIDALEAELNRISGQTQYGTKKLLDGSRSSDALTFQVGANAGQTAAVTIANVAASALGDGTSFVDDISVTTAAGASEALVILDAAISQVSASRSSLGAFQNRMESTIRNVSVAVENLSAAESRIRDADMAEEMVTFTRNQILQQAGTAMLAQANQVPGRQRPGARVAEAFSSPDRRRVGEAL